jgi:hypothetical protein
MPTTIQGFEVITQPKNTTIESFPVFIQLGPGVTRTVTFPTEFNAIAIGLMVDNLDGAAACSFRINNSTAPMIPISASNFRSFDGMNIVSITVTTAAVTGSAIISGQMAALPKPINLGFL